jgi:prepilin-type N-terminal cleavage/methylation domain-containing protein
MIRRTVLPAARGFTLTEMAVVLVIMALLVGGMLLPLTAQDELRRGGETQATLKIAIESLLGFAAANGRLPCPGTAASNGIESFAAGGSASNGSCSNFHDGFLPGATLGLAPLDAQGRVLDAWGNPLRYAVTDADANAFTRTNGVQGVGMANIATTQLIVCPTGSGVQNAGTASADCSAAVTAYARNAVAIVHSLGKNAGTGGTGTDEQHNPNPNSPVAADRVFVSHDAAPATAANGEFDDTVLWLSPNVFFNRMIAAGRLP